MEVYTDFQIKDHYYWTDAAPEYLTKEEREAAKAKAQPAKTDEPRYEHFTEREADGSLIYYSVRVSEPVILDGMMI